MDEKWRPHNTTRLTPEQIAAMKSQARGRYLAYEPPSKDVADNVSNIKKRLAMEQYQQSLRHRPPPKEVQDDMIKNRNVMGHLKAAEASNRICLLRLRYETRFKRDMSYLVEFQPIALKAMRLEALLPPKEQLTALDRVKIDKPTRYKIDELMKQCDLSSLKRL